MRIEWCEHCRGMRVGLALRTRGLLGLRPRPGLQACQSAFAGSVARSEHSTPVLHSRAVETGLEIGSLLLIHSTSRRGNHNNSNVILF